MPCHCVMARHEKSVDGGGEKRHGMESSARPQHQSNSASHRRKKKDGSAAHSVRASQRGAHHNHARARPNTSTVAFCCWFDRSIDRSMEGWCVLVKPSRRVSRPHTEALGGAPTRPHGDGGRDDGRRPTERARAETGQRTSQPMTRLTQASHRIESRSRSSLMLCGRPAPPPLTPPLSPTSPRTRTPPPPPPHKQGPPQRLPYHQQQRRGGSLADLASAVVVVVSSSSRRYEDEGGEPPAVDGLLLQPPTRGHSRVHRDVHGAGRPAQVMHCMYLHLCVCPDVGREREEGGGCLVAF